MKEKRQKWSREELKENFYCFYYDPENPSGTCTTERTCSLWRERNKTERLYIDANKLANVRQDVMKEKRLTEANFRKEKQVKTEKVVVTKQPESELEGEEIFVGFDSEGKPVILKECKVVVEDLLCDTQERNEIHN